MKTIRIMSMVILVCQQLWASPVPDFPFISASAEAEKAVVPDRATITFRVMSHKVKSEAAVDEVENILKALILKLEKTGMKKEDLEASDLEKSEVRKQTEQRKELEILGYDVSRSVTLEVKEMGLYSDLVSLIFKADGVTGTHTRFHHSKSEELKLELLTEACAKARRKGERLAKAAGVRIKRVHAVSDEDHEGMRPWFGYGGWVPRLGGADLGNSEPSIFVPKEIELRVMVSMLFRLEE